MIEPIAPIALERLAERVLRRLSESGATFATAESGTSGLLHGLLTRTPRSAEAYRGGAIVDSDAEKVQQLGVRQKFIDQLGSVSNGVAHEMAKGALQRFGVDVVVAITALAGPDGGTVDKPVGSMSILAYGFPFQGGTRTGLNKLVCPGGPDETRRLSAWWGMTLVEALIDQKERG